MNWPIHRKTSFCKMGKILNQGKFATGIKGNSLIIFIVYILANSKLATIPSCFEAFKISFFYQWYKFCYSEIYDSKCQVSDSSEYIFIGSEPFKTWKFVTCRQPLCLQGKMAISKNSVPQKAQDVALEVAMLFLPWFIAILQFWKWSNFDKILDNLALFIQLQHKFQ